MAEMKMKLPGMVEYETYAEVVEELEKCREENERLLDANKEISSAYLDLVAHNSEVVPVKPIELATWITTRTIVCKPTPLDVITAKILEEDEPSVSYLTYDTDDLTEIATHLVTYCINKSTRDDFEE